MSPTKAHCTVCGSDGVELFFEMADVPVLCNVLHASRESALDSPRGDLHLGFCPACGHIYNYQFNPALMTYTQAYENTLHFSPRFQRYAEGLADGLIDRYSLRNKTIIEIGCGKGDFLRLICERGGNTGIGFDESFQPDLMEGRNERLTVVRDFYSEKYSHYKPDFVCCRHVLEHIQSPVAFLSNIHHLISSECSSYFEVPNTLFTLKDLAIWDLIYEHCSYFTPQSLEYLFSSCRFDVMRLKEQYDSQFLGIEAKPVSQTRGLTRRTTTDLNRLVASFSDNYEKKKEEWRRRLEGWHQKRVVVWGSGSKGVTFLNVLRPNVEFVVDLNPRKQGMFVPGSGQRIVGAEFLYEYKPDVVIVMNPIYQSEIEDILRKMKIHPTVAVA